MGTRPGRPLTLVLLAGLMCQAHAATTWLEARIEIEDFAAAGDVVSAIALEEPYFELVASAFGESSEELAAAYLFLVPLHANTGDILTVEKRIFDAIDIYERELGPHSTRLILPFELLGDSYLTTGEYELAIGAYNEARSIGRRAYGLLNTEQLDILDKMAEATLAAGDFDEAEALQQEGLDLVRRRDGEGSQAYLQANYAYADWLIDHFAFGDVNAHYASMRRLIDQYFEDDIRTQIRHLRMVAGGMRRISSSYPGARISPTELEQALELAEDLGREGGESDPRLMAEILMDIGDWNVAFERDWETAEAYEAAWQHFAEPGGADRIDAEWFEQSTVIYSPPLISRALSRDPRDPIGRVSLQFTVTREGRTESITVIESDPSGLLDEAAIRRIRNSKYRPRIEAGKVVASTKVETFDFRYQKE